MEKGSSVATLVSSSPIEYAKTKTSKRNYLVLAGALAVTAGFIVATSLLVDQVVKSNNKLRAMHQELTETKRKDFFLNQEPVVCWTNECLISSVALMESIDQTVDPCEDFYQFACGGWINKNAIPPGHGETSHFALLSYRIDEFNEKFFRENSNIYDSEAVNKTRQMYTACMDTKSIEKLGMTPLIEILNTYGQWPMTVSNWTEDRFDWRKVSASIRNTFGYGFLFSVSNFFDILDTEMSTIYLDQPDLGIDSFILKDKNLTSYEVDTYSTFITGVAYAVRDVINGGASNESISKDIEDMISFNIELVGILTPEDERNYENITTYYNPFLLSELQNWTDSVNTTSLLSQINWHEYLSDIYSVVNVSIYHDERIIVMEPFYIQKLVQLLDQTSPRVIANFIHWNLALNSIKHLNREMEVLLIEFIDALFGFNPLPPRDYFCGNDVYRKMGFAISSKYIEKNFDPQGKREVKEMVSNIKIAFSSLIEESGWMDQETKTNALEKAIAMNALIAYPDWIANRTTLDYAYRGLKTKTDKHFANVVSTQRFLTASNLKFLRFRTDIENLWLTFPGEVNAFYFPFFNAITFPVGILQPPFYGGGRLAAQNYGAIGAIIGHEITHGFDHQGHKRDKKGKLRSWWTNQTLEKFQERKQCIIEQYSNFTIPKLLDDEQEDPMYHIDGNQTQGENIADNGGIREAFRAYQNHVARNGRDKRLPGLERYTPEQIFFLSYANMWCANTSPSSLAKRTFIDVHSPARFRVLGPLANSADFAEHFQCPIGSPMNPEKKCTVW